MSDAEPTVTLRAPLTAEAVDTLRAGTRVRISGTIYTARDAAHKRLCAALAAGEALPVDLTGQLLYYVGPSPAPPGRIIGSAGPTTSARMDPYTPELIARSGLRAMVGKGPRGPAVIDAMRAHGCVYLAATGGAAALLAECIDYADVVAYEDLGPEAIHRLEVNDFPAIVAIDSSGNSLYRATG
ncbi:MAG: Fe-S-containing hydro-lyase [Planctomycetota bacterium]